ncbi:MAG: YqhA family protein [Candidatus Sericytochromatia bacterium]|nr:YqhA family protein [Candidatus Sericytochromatia bacterium]
MKKILNNSKFIVFLAIIGLMIDALFAFIWGIIKSVKLISIIMESYGQERLITIYFIQIMDSFLIAILLFIFSVSIYELFIGKLDLPEWMLSHSFEELKVKLSNVIVLVLVIKFVEKLVEWDNAKDTLMYAISVTLISAILLVLSNFSHKDKD